MTDHREIAAIAADADRLVTESYRSGVAEGRRQVTEEMRVVFAEVFKRIAGDGPTLNVIRAATTKLNEGAPNQEARQPSNPGAPRAAPGTVKPALLDIITNAADGITAEELIVETGFKANSVRGTLSTLREEKAIAKISDKWFSAERVLARGHAEGKAEIF